MRFDKYDAEYIGQAYKEKFDKYAAVRKLAREYKCKPEDIFKCLKENGVIGKDYVEKRPTKEKKSKRYSAEEIETMLSMRENGADFDEIGEAINRDVDSVKVKYYSLTKQKTVKKEPVKPETTSEPVEAASDKTLVGYTVAVQLDGAQFKTLDAVKSFLSELKMRGCELSGLCVFETNQVEIA